MKRTLFLIVVLLVCKAEAQSSVLSVADNLYNSGNYTAAINQYSKLGTEHASFQIAKAYNAIGNYDKSIAQYENVLEKNSNFNLARFNLGKLYLKIKKPEKAMLNFLKLTTSDKKNPEYFYYLGRSFEAIKKKLKPNSKKQLFILSVSPGSFAAPYSISANDIIKIDKNTILGKVSLVKTNPNYNYIVNTYNKPLYNALHPYEKWENYTLHDNGWLEVKLKESKAIQIRNTKLWKSDVIRHFKENVIKQEISNYRINSFIEMVKFLKEKGDVFLVLIPEDKELMALEKNFSPNFESKIDSISNNLNVPFLNYSNLVDKFKTYDGLHFESEGAQEFTKTLSIDIKKHLKTKKHPNFQ